LLDSKGMRGANTESHADAVCSLVHNLHYPLADFRSAVRELVTF
jgi:hypothetical protein